MNVQPARLKRHESAVASQLEALVVSPLARARSAAARSPAISAAIEEGDLPNCSSQRSVVSGPELWMWFAVVLTLLYVVESVSPVAQASRIAKESWSSCSQHPSCCGVAPLIPLTGL